MGTSVPLETTSMFSNLPLVITVGVGLVDFGVKVAALGLIPENRRPSSATA